MLKKLFETRDEKFRRIKNSVTRQLRGFNRGLNEIEKELMETEKKAILAQKSGDEGLLKQYLQHYVEKKKNFKKVQKIYLAQSLNLDKLKHANTMSQFASGLDDISNVIAKELPKQKIDEIMDKSRETMDLVDEVSEGIESKLDEDLNQSYEDEDEILANEFLDRISFKAKEDEKSTLDESDAKIDDLLKRLDKTLNKE